MKRQSQVLLAVALVAAGAAGCFKDPVDSLRNGPAVLDLSQTAVYLKSGDSTAVIAYLKDAAGNVLPATGPTWTSSNPAVAVVNVPVDAAGNPTPAIPGNAYTRANIRGVDSVTGGATTVIITSRGIADTIRVVVIPAKLTTAQHVSYAGTTLTDTVVKPPDVLIPGDTIKHYSYSAKDTLILSGTSTLTFDTAKVTVQVATTNGASKGLIVSKTPSTLKVVFQTGTAGKVMVQHLLLTPGDPTVGTIKVDTLIGDSVAVAPWRIGPAVFGASVTQVADTVTVNAGTGQTFDANTLVTFSAATDAGTFSDTAFVISRSASALNVLAPKARTPVRVTARKVIMTGGTGVASVTFDSLTTNDKAYTVNLPTLPASAIVQTGDTLNITAVGPMTFDATTGVSFGANSAIIVARTATTLSYVLSGANYTGPVTLTNAFVGLTQVPALSTTGSYTLNAFALPAANVSLGGGKLGDTITITAPAGLPFSTTGTVSKVTLGNTAIATSDTAWILSRTATTIKAFAKRGGTGKVTVTRLNLGALIIPTLSTVATMKIDSVASDFAGGTTMATARALTIPANDTAIVYGATPPSGNDFWTFTTAAAHVIKGSVAWFGTGNPYTANPPVTTNTDDIDMLLCNASTVCDESGPDLTGGAAASATQPEKFTSASLPAAQYWIGVLDFNAHYSIVYQLTLILQ